MANKDIFIVHLGNRCGAMGVVGENPRRFYSFCPKGKFADWVAGMIEDYPNFKLRCVQNKEIEEWLRNRLPKDKEVINNGRNNFER